jgi:hypothetical protein
LTTETGSHLTAPSAIESFSVCNSTTNDRNTGLGGRFRAACGSGERSESRTRPILGSFYPQESDSGPRRKWAAPPGIRRSPYQSNSALQSKRHRIAANKNVGRDGEWQSLKEDIAGVGSVSANAMDRRHLRRIRGARSSTKRCDEGSGAHTLGPFFYRVTVSAGPVPSLPQEVARGFEMTGSIVGWFRGPGIDRLGAGHGD